MEIPLSPVPPGCGTAPTGAAEPSPELAEAKPARPPRRRSGPRMFPVPPGAAPLLPEGAVCASHPEPDLWTSEERRDVIRAREGCRICPVRAECLEAALRLSPVEGIWGGLSAAERATLARVRALRGSRGLRGRP